MSENPSGYPKKSSGPLIIFLIIILAVAAYLGWNFIAGNNLLKQPQNGTEPKVSWLKRETPEKVVEEPAPAEQLEVKEQPSPTLATEETESIPEPPDECLQTADKILLFFEHLDSQEYIKGYSLKGSARDHMAGIINKLLANPPVVVRETDDLFAILNNMAHFFRILGPKDILLIKEVLSHEQELVEPTMALFYKWSEIEPDCLDNNLGIKLPLNGLYEYAGYFINTLGGQSYLFRRTLYLRLLIRYYSILVIDRSNNVDANRYGIDIRYTLNSLISEIEANGDLVNKEEYLQTLISLQESYQAKYGKR
jgi:hypothetical protein